MESIIEAYYVKDERRWSDVPSEGAELRYIIEHPINGFMDVDEHILLKPDEKGNGWIRRYDLFSVLVNSMKENNLDPFVDNMEISQMKKLLKNSAKAFMETEGFSLKDAPEIIKDLEE